MENMKTPSDSNRRAPFRRIIFYGSVLLLLLLATLARADVPVLAVSVSDTNGKVVFSGATKAGATFATQRLAPGEYVVQLKSSASIRKGERYLLVASAGRKKIIADNVAGEMFTGPGVAMKVRVSSRIEITGQVARSAAMSYHGDPKVKVIDGRIYLWVDAETGSHLGGRWVEGSLADGRQIVALKPSWLNRMQENSGEGNLANHYNAMGTRIR